MKDCISIRGARLHNLKNISLDIPKNRLVVLTGLSGSGKSSLAFGTIHIEGLRQFFESLGMVAHDVSKPRIDRIEGLTATINIDQEITNKSPRSTVGTVSEVFTYLRVLFAKLGRQTCPGCGMLVPPPLLRSGTTGDSGDDEDFREDACPSCGKELPALSMGHFSFNKPEGACPECTGIGEIIDVRLELLLDPSKTIADGGVILWDRFEMERYAQTLRNAGKYYGFEFDTDKPIGEYTQEERDLLVAGVDSYRFKRHFPSKEAPDTVAKGRFEGIATGMIRRYQEHIEDAKYRKKMERYIVRHACPSCGGTRLREEVRGVTVAGKDIVHVSSLSVEDLYAWTGSLEDTFTVEERQAAETVLSEMRERIGRILDVGLGYLTFERSAPTLSGGEAQRLRLSNILGSGLTGLMYILDEPTIGLHPRDNRKLIGMLKKIRDLGNTVLVIEHELDLIAEADMVIDLGPGAGADGGYLLAAAPPTELMRIPESVTGPYLADRTLVLKKTFRKSSKFLRIRGAREFNLKNIDVDLPLGTLTAITGVSGSGKSTLVFDILEKAARKHFSGSFEEPGAHDRIDGWDRLKSVVAVDQVPIGRSTRSNTATYTDTFTEIRKLYGNLPEARSRGLNESHFSFNIPGGRCERCEGSGNLIVSMHFLPDVPVPCPVCRGKRFMRKVQEVTYRGKSVSDVLDMSIEEARRIFSDAPPVLRRLNLLHSIGLGYLGLGQSTSTLSGGEAQRIKLAKDLVRGGSGGTLYLLDEPTRGLHPKDIENLVAVLDGLVEKGNTVVVIEHSLELISRADWIIDLGPEGGRDGGRLLVAGTPADVMKTPDSFTGAELRRRIRRGT